MKRVISVFLCVLLSLPMGVSALAATTNDLSTAQEVVTALSIITPNKGSYNLKGTLTRAELAKILVNTSVARTSVPGKSTTSPYKDVKFNYWAAPYIKVAAANGYMTSFPDGSFKPTQTVLIEDAVVGMLKVLGYTTADYGVDFPYAPMSFAAGKNVDILRSVSTKVGKPATRQDMIMLAYNSLDTAVKGGNGRTLIQTLGYTRAGVGEALDIDTIEPDETEGPITVQNGNWYTGLGLTATTGLKAFRNNEIATAEAITQNDIVYYSPKQKTLYAYARSVVGVLENVLPSRQMPNAVIVAGQTYQLETEKAIKAFSAAGTFNRGELVTLLLGSDGRVADVQLAKDGQNGAYALILQSDRKDYIDAAGKSYKSDYVKAMLADGSLVEYRTAQDYYTFAGAVARIDFEKSVAVLTGVGDQATLTGKVDAVAGSIGAMKVAPGVKLLDVADKAGRPITLDRLDGMDAGALKPYCITLNGRNQIESIFFNNVSGDAAIYGVITGITNVSVGNTASAEIAYIANGQDASLRYTTSTVVEQYGPASFTRSTQAGNMSGLEPKLLHTLGMVKLENNVAKTTTGAAFKLADAVQIYDYTNSSKPKLITASQAVAMGSKVTMEAFYDKEMSQGGRIRIITVRNV